MHSVIVSLVLAFGVQSASAMTADTAKECYQGKYRYALDEGAAGIFKFKLDKSSGDWVFNTELLNPAEMLKIGGTEMRADAAFVAVEKDVKMESETVRCPCVSVFNENYSFEITEIPGGSNITGEGTAFAGSGVDILEIIEVERCDKVSARPVGPSLPPGRRTQGGS